MAGIAGKAGRPKRTEETESIFLRLRAAVMRDVWRCKGALEQREGVSLSKAEAVERILQAGCQALAQAQTLAGPGAISEISEISSSQISEISKILKSRARGTAHQLDDRGQPSPALHTRPGQNKLTPRQVASLRAKRARRVPIKSLMEEYGISKATVFRYLQEA
jgi:predicted DNA binding protein